MISLLITDIHINNGIVFGLYEEHSLGLMKFYEPDEFVGDYELLTTEGENAEMIVLSIQATNSHRAIMFNHSGQVIGAISYTIESNDIVVNGLGSLVKGVGTKLMRHVSRRANKLGLEMELTSSPSARGFYERLGLEPAGGSEYMASVRQVAKMSLA